MDVVHLVTRALSAPPEREAIDERILDGALARVAASGTRGATMDAVARAAGVGRMTVFRRFGGKDALLERLVLRELRRFLAEVDATLDTARPPGERVVEAFLACLRAGREHPLVARLARREPEAAMALLARGDPSALEIGRAFVAAHLRADGLDDPDGAADVLVRLATSYVLFPAAWIELEDDATARAFAQRVLAPLVGP